MVPIVKALLSGRLLSGRAKGHASGLLSKTPLSQALLSKAFKAAAAGTLIGSMAMPLAATAQSAESESAEPDATEVEVLPAEAQPPADASGAMRAVESSDSRIGIAAGQALMSEAESAISSQNYTLASEKLVAARAALNDVSTHYRSVSEVFVGVDSRVTSALRALALESAEVRDEASYQLAVVYRAQDRPDLAVPLLVEVVQSQQPTRDLGQKAYQQLYELGFVGVPYSAPGG
ncbi:MAG: hypothetical protein AAF171_07595 [Cyanobacteria bacterium P01_A01_bin.116]